jgi:hypothetical protein
MNRRDFLRRLGGFSAVALSGKFLQGCASCDFPALSGCYRLTKSPVYTNPSFEGKLVLPPTLVITNRMEHGSSRWNHFLGFDFRAEGKGQASGKFALDLDEMIQSKESSFPHKVYKGATVHAEEKINGTSAFCNSQIFYHVFLEVVPDVKILINTYPGKGEYFGKDPVNGMEQHAPLKDPGNVEFNPEAWENAIDDNDGITLKIQFARNRAEVRPGWDGGHEDCFISTDERFSEDLDMEYHASLDDLNLEVDIRKGGYQGIDYGMGAAKYFSQVVSGILRYEEEINKKIPEEETQSIPIDLPVS